MSLWSWVVSVCSLNDSTPARKAWKGSSERAPTAGDRKNAALDLARTKLLEELRQPFVGLKRALVGIHNFCNMSAEAPCSRTKGGYAPCTM